MLDKYTYLNKMVSNIILVSLLQITTILTAPLQMLQPLQGIMQQQMLQHRTNQQQLSLLQQLQRMSQQQMTLQGETQHQMPLSGTMQQQFPLQPLQGTIQQQRLALEEQMFALQQFQALQKINLIPSSMAMNAPPILVLFPNNKPNLGRTDFNINSLKYQKPEDIGDDDSDIIDAEPVEESNVRRNPMRAVLLIPNTRSFIGDFISSIPFLPIEINVPDSISWIYNGIAGIISSIGQNLPFRPQAENSVTENEAINTVNTKSIWNKKQQMPIIVIPIGQLS